MPTESAGSGTQPTWVTQEVDLPGRGRMAIRSVQGPPGAPTIVLLHGLAATGRLNWFHAVPALAEHFNLIVVDHRGHGRGIRTSHFRLADCADDVAALVDQLGIESFIAVGYSMGGPIAKLCWHRHPDRVRGLVLCATAKHFLRSDLKPVTALYPGVIFGARLVPKLFRDRIIDGLVGNIPDPERRARVRSELAASEPATVVQASRAVLRFSSHDWVSDISVPSAVLVMTRDELVPPRRQYSLAKSIPGAELFEVSGDHVACVSAPGRFVPALVEACLHVDSASQDGAAHRTG